MVPASGNSATINPATIVRIDDANDQPKWRCGRAEKAPTRPKTPIATRIQPNTTPAAAPAMAGKRTAPIPSAIRSAPSTAIQRLAWPGMTAPAGSVDEVVMCGALQLKAGALARHGHMERQVRVRRKLQLDRRSRVGRNSVRVSFHTCGAS